MDLIAYEIYGVRLIGVNAANGRKLLFTLVFLAVLWTATNGKSRVKLWTGCIGIASGTYAIVEVPPVRVIQTTPLPDAR